MTKTLRGVIYDTDEDEMVAGEGLDGGWLYRTPGGELYLQCIKAQVFDGEWRDKRDDEEEFPLPYRRLLHTFRPMTERAAYRWCVQNMMPECFQARALSAQEHSNGKRH